MHVRLLWWQYMFHDSALEANLLYSVVWMQMFLKSQDIFLLRSLDLRIHIEGILLKNSYVKLSLNA